MKTTNYQTRTKTPRSDKFNMVVSRSANSSGFERVIVEVDGDMIMRWALTLPKAREIAGMLLEIADGPFELSELKD
jgi:hypothetical protein